VAVYRQKGKLSSTKPRKVLDGVRTIFRGIGDFIRVIKIRLKVCHLFAEEHFERVDRPL
jgi:hypothetical protein